MIPEDIDKSPQILAGPERREVTGSPEWAPDSEWLRGWTRAQREWTLYTSELGPYLYAGTN
ncbi:hypothetical protein BDM02DRAFT_3121718 [Thelephora ganbajun]|uniref:Uncharacterized protein n=1 Tax=Thelephora ganbajun TaxID=370292 RepID=A0ACB6Z4S2_THEGA|nr:hypothetical protein BDM02DRAFT_3121718 [Thelephora ganbajun]